MIRTSKPQARTWKTVAKLRRKRVLRILAEASRDWWDDDMNEEKAQREAFRLAAEKLKSRPSTAKRKRGNK